MVTVPRWAFGLLVALAVAAVATIAISGWRISEAEARANQAAGEARVHAEAARQARERARQDSARAELVTEAFDSATTATARLQDSLAAARARDSLRVAQLREAATSAAQDADEALARVPAEVRPIVDTIVAAKDRELDAVREENQIHQATITGLEWEVASLEELLLRADSVIAAERRAKLSERRRAEAGERENAALRRQVAALEDATATSTLEQAVEVGKILGAAYAGWEARGWLKD